LASVSLGGVSGGSARRAAELENSSRLIGGRTAMKEARAAATLNHGHRAWARWRGVRFVHNADDRHQCRDANRIGATPGRSRPPSYMGARDGRSAAMVAIRRGVSCFALGLHQFRELPPTPTGGAPTGLTTAGSLAEIGRAGGAGTRSGAGFQYHHATLHALSELSPPRGLEHTGCSLFSLLWPIISRSGTSTPKGDRHSQKPIRRLRPGENDRRPQRYASFARPWAMGAGADTFAAAG